MGTPRTLSPAILLLIIGVTAASAQPTPNTVIATIPNVATPSDLALQELNNRLYVAQSGPNTVAVIDTEIGSPTENTVLLSIPLPGFNPQGVAVNRSTDRLYATHFGGVSVIDIEIGSANKNTVIDTIPLVGNSIAVAVHDLIDRLYVAVADNLAVIDTLGDHNILITSIPVGNLPRSVAVNKAIDRAYVANALSNDVSVIDIEIGSPTVNTVIDTISVGTLPIDAEVAEDSNRLYVANYESDSVSVIDIEGGSTTENTVIGTISVGVAPADLAVNEDTKRLYVSNSGSDTVSVIDTLCDANVVLATIDVDHGPYGVVVNRDAGRAYVGNVSQNTVSVIEIEIGVSPPCEEAPPCEETIAYVTERDAAQFSVVDLASGNIPIVVSQTIGGPDLLWSKLGGVALDASESTVVVTDPDTEELYFYDVATGGKTQLAFGLTNPTGLALNAAGTSVYVIEADSGELSAVDLRPGAGFGTVTQVTSGLTEPRNVALNAAETTAYLTDAAAGQLVAVDLTPVDFGIVTVIASGLSTPDGVAVNAAETLAYVSQKGLDVLSEIDVATGVIARSFSGLSSPAGVALNAAETKAYVTEETGGRLSVVDLTSGLITPVAIGLTTPVGVALSCSGATIKIPLRWCGVEGAPSIQDPWQVLETSTDDVLVRRHQRVTDNITLSQSRIAFRSGATAALPNLPIIPDPDTSIGLPGDVFYMTVLSGVKGLALNTTETKVFVTEAATAELSEVDLTTGAITRTASGLGLPQDVVLNAAGTKAYVTQWSGLLGKILEVELATGTVSQKASGLWNPSGLVLNASGTEAFVTERTSGELSKVDLATGVITLIADTDLSLPNGLALNAAETKVFVTELGNGELSEVDLLTGTVTQVELERPLGDPWRVVLNSAETKAFVVEGSNYRLSEVDIATGSVTEIAGGKSASGRYLLGFPVGLAVNSAETKAFIAEGSTNEVSEVDLATGNITTIVTTTWHPDEVVSLNNACRSVWEDPLNGDPTVTGITSIHIRQFVDADGNPLPILGLAAGAAFVNDHAFFLPCDHQSTPCLRGTYGDDPVDKILGHELGHELGLLHGDGLDDDGDGLVDGPNEIDNKTGPNLMQGSLDGIEITTAQSLRMRGVAVSQIPDAEVNPVPLPLASSRTDAFRDVPPGEEFIDIDSYGLSQHQGMTALSLSVTGLFPEDISGLEFFFVADLDNNPATGGSAGGPTTLPGVEFVGSVEVDVSEGVATVIPTVSVYDGGTWEEIEDPSIEAQVLTQQMSLFQESPLEGAPTEIDIGQEIRLEFADSVIGPMANDIWLEVIAQGGGGSDTASALLTFEKPLFAGCSVEPFSALLESEVTVEAEGLPPDLCDLPPCLAEVYLGTDLVATGPIDDAGRADFSFAIPINSRSGSRSVTVQVVDTAITANCTVMVEPTNVGIDILPGTYPNLVNLKSKGVIQVAVLTTETFDATTVDPSSVTFGRGRAPAYKGRGRIEDADGDGDNDLVFRFKTQESRIFCGDISASLTGQTFDGQAIKGSDSIETVGCK